MLKLIIVGKFQYHHGHSAHAQIFLTGTVGVARHMAFNMLLKCSSLQSCNHSCRMQSNNSWRARWSPSLACKGMSSLAYTVNAEEVVLPYMPLTLLPKLFHAVEIDSVLLCTCSFGKMWSSRCF